MVAHNYYNFASKFTITAVFNAKFCFFGQQLSDSQKLRVGNCPMSPSPATMLLPTLAIRLSRSVTGCSINIIIVVITASRNSSFAADKQNQHDLSLNIMPCRSTSAPRTLDHSETVGQSLGMPAQQCGDGPFTLVIDSFYRTRIENGGLQNSSSGYTVRNEGHREKPGRLRKPKCPAVAKEDALQPVQFLLKY